MSKQSYILLIAPNAPPVNGAEAIQVRRILSVLDQKAYGRLITVFPTQSGWGKADASLDLPLQHFDRQQLALPLHRFTHRILTAHRLARLHRPDSFFWIRWMAGHIIASLPQKPDIIYSRSTPMSAALLAHELKQKLHIPWVMHLSDPWADSPYKTPNARDAADEAICFAQADLITLTTPSQADHYRKKYPHAASKIFIFPNVMADAGEASTWLQQATALRDERLHVVFAGNLYAERSPEPLVQALDILRTTQPATLKKIHIDVYGQAQEAARTALSRAADVIHYHGPVSFQQAYSAQHAADIVLSIEPEIDHPLGRSFLPSKVVDCLALRKPLLALTPAGSETETICREGYGWAVSPNNPAAIAAQLVELISMLPQLRQSPTKAPPQHYSAATVVDDLLMHMNRILTTTTS